MSNERMEQQNPWLDDDLADIMALLDKDYTKPQPRAAAAVREDFPVVKSQPAPASEDEFADLKALLDKDYTKSSHTGPKKPFLPTRQEEAVFDDAPFAATPWQDESDRKKDKPRQEFDPALTFHRQKMGAVEEADFDDTPAKAPNKDWLTIPLAIVALAEVAGIACVIVWWMQWL